MTYVYSYSAELFTAVLWNSLEFVYHNNTQPIYTLNKNSS